MACPDASAAIHECVLAIRARVPIEVLADTIHAFPSTSRILNGLFADARASSTAHLRGRRLAARTPTSPSIITQPRAGRRERAARLDRVGRGPPPGARRGPPAGPGSGGRDPARRPIAAGATHAARSACSRVMRSSGPNGALPAGHEPSTRVTAIDRPGHGSIGSTGASVPNASTAPASERATASGSRASRLDRPTAAARSRRRPGRGSAGSRRRSRPRANRARSSGWSSWTCSSRGMSADPAGRRLQRIERGPARAGRRSRGSGSRSRRRPPARANARDRPPAGSARSPASVPGGSGWPGSGSIGSRSAAVRDASVPSANSFSQPNRARPPGGPSGSPLRSSPRSRPPSCSERIEAWTRSGRSPRSSSAPVRGDRPPEPVLERQRARDRGRRRPRAGRARGRAGRSSRS